MEYNFPSKFQTRAKLPLNEKKINMKSVTALVCRKVENEIN